MSTSRVSLYTNRVGKFNKMRRNRQSDKTNAHLLHIYSRTPTHKLFTSAAHRDYYSRSSGSTRSPSWQSSTCVLCLSFHSKCCRVRTLPAISPRVGIAGTHHPSMMAKDEAILVSCRYNVPICKQGSSVWDSKPFIWGGSRISGQNSHFAPCVIRKNLIRILEVYPMDPHGGASAFTCGTHILSFGSTIQSTQSEHKSRQPQPPR